ncbi:MAG TPA: beta-ketoacyl synthase N-terminal-like domain-containing protein [Streptosporangiaceae bacterium]
MAEAHAQSAARPATPIAIVGLACRFPDADDPPALLDLILTGRRAFRRLPPGRLDLSDYYSADPATADATYSTRAAVLEGWQFDQPAFGISRPDFLSADPAHWLALETAARALAGAGFPGGDGLDRDRVGVIIGNALGGDTSRARNMRLRWPYVRRVLAEAMIGGRLPAETAGQLMRRAEARFLAPFPAVTETSLAGSMPATISARICGHFGFRGGGLAVDGACASGLLAVVSAGAALTTGEADVMIAGGVDLSLDPLELVGLAKTGVLATDEVRIYDEDPTGFLPGEGCGLVVLMRAADARAAGLPVYAEIAGWGTSSPGRPTVTGADAASQLLALRRAYQRAGIEPGEVQLIEGHGAGTAIADRAELDALARLRGSSQRQAALGSVKANIGHAGAAAGAAGLIKTVLALGTGVIPPATGVSRPHPLLRDGQAGLRLPQSPEAWPAGTRLAGVSAMGSSGLNVHVVLRTEPAGRSLRGRVAEAVPRGPRGGAGPAAGMVSTQLAAGAPQAMAYLLHAPDRLRLTALLSRLVQIAPWLSDGQMHDLACQLAGEADVQGQARVGIVAARPTQLARLASQALHLLPQLSGGLLTVRPGIFAADGADGRVTLLLSDDRAAAGQATALEPAGTGPDWHAAENLAGQARPAASGPFAALEWLGLLGVRATAAVGHGLGEIAGLAWAGCLTEDSASLLASLRAQILADTVLADTGLADTGLADTGLAGTGLAGRGPGGQGPAGHGSAPAADQEAGHGQDAGAVMAAIGERQGRMRAAAARFRFRPPQRRLICTSTGRELAAAAEVADLLLAGSGPASGLADALAAGAVGATLMIETGPGQALAEASAQLCRVPSVSLGAGRDSTRQAMRAAAALFAAGALDDAAPLYAGQPRRPFDLWREQVFLTSPCQADPGPAATELAAGRPGLALLAAAASQGDQDSRVIEGAATAGQLTGAPANAFEETNSGQNAAVTMTVSGPGTHDGAGRQDHARLPVRRTGQASTAAAAGQPITTSTAQAEAAWPVSAPALVTGLRPWARCYAEELRPPAGPLLPADDGPWRVLQAPGHPFGPAAGELFRDDRAAGRTLVVLGDQADPGTCAAALQAARDAITTGELVVLTDGPGTAGFWASLHAEHPSVGVTVLRVPPTPAGLRAAATFATTVPGQLRELDIDSAGRVRQPVMVPATLTGGGTFPLGPDDVVLVSRGTRGAGLVLAQVLACCGASVAVIGRAAPDEDERVVTRIEQLRQAGAKVSFEIVDIASPADMKGALQRIERRLGQVTAVGHATGPSVSIPLAGLTDAYLRGYAAAENSSLTSLVSAIDTRRLRLIATFGSVAGRYGLAREGLLALAGGTLASAAERLAASIPGCQAVHVDWAAWADEDLAQDDGLAESMRLAGATPITTGSASRLLLKMLATPGLPGRLAVHGRAGAPPPAAIAAAATAPPPELQAASRFLEVVRLHYPGVELVCEARLSLATDPYLGDYRLDSLPVLPPAMAIEAMAEAAAFLAGRPLRRATAVAMNAPVVVPARGSSLIRLCALAEDGMVTVSLRSEESAFRLDHYCATFGPADDGSSPQHGPASARTGSIGERTGAGPDGSVLDGTVLDGTVLDGTVPEGTVPGGAVLDGAELYGQLCFQAGRFRRIASLTEVSSRSCRALARAGDDQPWFGAAPAGPEGQRSAGTSSARTGPASGLLLGSQGIYDATIHAVQACVPDRRIEVAGCETAVFSGRAPSGVVGIRAVAIADPVREVTATAGAVTDPAADGVAGAGLPSQAQPAARQPATGQPATGQPATGQPGTRQHGAGQVSAGQVSADQISAAIPRQRQPMGLTSNSAGTPEGARTPSGAGQGTAATAEPSDSQELPRRDPAAGGSPRRAGRDDSASAADAASAAANAGPAAAAPPPGAPARPAPGARPNHAELTWDVLATDSAGQQVVTWRRLRFRDAGALPRTEPWPAALLAVQLERTAAALGLDPGLRVLIDSQQPGASAPPGRTTGQRAGAAGPAGRSAQRGAAVPAQRAGKATARGAGELDGFTLAVRGAQHAVCAWAAVVKDAGQAGDSGHPAAGSRAGQSSPAGDSQSGGRSRTGKGLAQLAADLREQLDEPPEATVARLQAIGGCLRAAGAPAASAELRGTPGDDGWVTVSAAGALLACTVARLAGLRHPVAIAIMTGQPQKTARPPAGQRRSAKASGRPATRS